MATLGELGIDRLSVSERIELIGLIWDSLSDADQGAATPQWHLDELDRRIAADDANPQVRTPWEVVKARLTKPS